MATCKTHRSILVGAAGAAAKPARWRIARVALLLMLAQLALVSPAHAASCDSAAKIAVDLWDEYGKYAKQLGCTVASAATVAATSGGTGDPATIQKECLADAEKSEQLARQMIATWNRLAANRWATLGPRQLQLDTTHQGTVVGPGTRLFLTPAPVGVDAIDVAFTKEDFRGPAEVTVCTYAPGDIKARRWNFRIERGDDNTGRLWLQRIEGVKGKLVSVHIVGKSAFRKLAYRLNVVPDTAETRGSEQVAAETGVQKPRQQAPRGTNPIAERQGAVVAKCEGKLPASPADLRRGIAAPRIARPLPVPIRAPRPASPRVMAAVNQPAVRNVIAFTPEGGWVLARGTQTFARNIPDEAYLKLQAYTRAGKPVDAIAFTPDGGWTLVVDGASWTRNVGGQYHDVVTALVGDGKRVRSVAFNPANWRTRRGFVLAHEDGFTAEGIPGEMCEKLKEFTRAGTPLDAVAFTPDGGWTIVAGDTSWTRNVGGPAPSYHDTVTAALASGASVHAVAFDPARYGARHGWVLVTNRGFHARSVPEEAETQLVRTLGLDEL